jgi:nucleoside-diphosphate-sugar epimerase
LAETQYIVHTSFSFLYGDTHGETVSEDHALDTSAPLFKAAAAGEKAVLNGAVPGCVLRAGFNYGPDSDSIHALHRALISRGPVNAGESAHASWIHTTDLANAITLTVTQQPENAVFNIVDDEPVAPSTFVDSFADHLGVAHPARTRLPAGLAQIAQFKTPASELALLATSVKASNAKAKEQLGWKLQYPSSGAGIEQTLMVWRAAAAT